MGTTNILLAGVGGQGVILVSELLALASLEEGFDVKQSEVHGVAQRGGAVVSHLRFGENIHSPICSPGKTDFLFSMELLESVRWAHYLKDSGQIILNNQKIPPVKFTENEIEYPENIDSFFKEKGFDYHIIDAYDEAKQLGNFRAANIILLGFLSTLLPFKSETWKKVIEKRIPERFLELNKKAFEKGRSISQ